MRLWERLLARTDPGGYNEMMYSGAEYVTSLNSGGQNREATPAGLVRLGREAYAANGVVFSAMAVRMALFAEARFQFQRMTDMGTFGNTDLGLLETPWPNADAGELLARLEQDGGLGNAYFRKVEPADGGDPLLVQMRPDQITIVSEETHDTVGRLFRRPVGYLEQTDPSREPQIYTTDEVAHYSPIPDPNARYRGMSWLTPVLADARADNKLTAYKSFHLDNGAMPGLVIKYAMKLSDPTIATLRKRVRAKYGGPENAGNVLVLDEGADLSVAGSTMEQLQFDAVTKVGERRVCAAAGPGMLVILGFEKGDDKAAVRQLADLWARPSWRKACAALQHLVPTSAGASPVRLWYDVSGVAALREGELARGQTTLVKLQGVQSAVQAGFTRKSAALAAETGDLSQLVEDPKAPPPGTSARETATETTTNQGSGPGQRPPQAGVPQNLPGVGKPNLPNANPGKFGPMPALPNGARGPNGSAAAIAKSGAKRSDDDPFWLGPDWEEE